MVIKKDNRALSVLALSTFIVKKQFFHSREGQAFSFRISQFLWNLKKNWANTNQIKIVGRNRIFPPLGIIKAAHAEERKSIIITRLSWKTINIADKIYKFYYMHKLKFVNFVNNYSL